MANDTYDNMNDILSQGFGHVKSLNSLNSLINTMPGSYIYHTGSFEPISRLILCGKVSINFLILLA